MKIGRRIYYDLKTGNVILNTNEREGSVVPTTVEQEVETFKVLSERNRDSFGYLELEYNQYAQDFTECDDYLVNPVTKELEFSYPSTSEVPTEPYFKPPLSAEIELLKKNNEEIVATNEMLTESLIEFKLQYTAVPCQLHREYPVIVESLIKEANADGTL